jgi:hypothetical protein
MVLLVVSCLRARIPCKALILHATLLARRELTAFSSVRTCLQIQIQAVDRLKSSNIDLRGLSAFQRLNSLSAIYAILVLALFIHYLRPQVTRLARETVHPPETIPRERLRFRTWRWPAEVSCSATILVVRLVRQMVHRTHEFLDLVHVQHRHFSIELNHPRTLTRWPVSVCSCLCLVLLLGSRVCALTVMNNLRAFRCGSDDLSSAQLVGRILTCIVCVYSTKTQGIGKPCQWK